ncbi:sigma-70 family RNA polymerase sigma factor [Paracoccus alkenifer]|nr:sigma-70 family RNA polymerase sigma factor [Paracoccus alkenifer]MDR5653951.1 sigma-70 family RNA polymerase sigma factor [Xinfangfangia sp. LG-4]
MNAAFAPVGPRSYEMLRSTVLPLVDEGALGFRGEDQQPMDDLSELSRDLIAVRDSRDRAAFGRLFDHFAPRLKAMMLRGGLRDGTAEDVVQDVMLAVWHKAGQFDPHRADAAGWIYGIARNRRIDMARRRPLAQPDEMPEIESLEPDAAQIIALQQEARHLADALARLAPEQAEALRAAYFDDIPHSRISEMTGLPLGTIKSRIRLGLERLRHELRTIAP